uniref:Uncharacterized protein n=1 Tax=Emiliania huxleyi TaxID=2903 RepID=A0A7S3WFK9_EMIHU
MSDAALATLLSSHGLSHLSVTLAAEDLTLSTLQYMATQPCFDADMVDVGVDAAAAAELRRALTSASSSGAASGGPSGGVSGGASPSGGAASSGGVSGARGMIGAALAVVDATDVVRGSGDAAEAGSAGGGAFSQDGFSVTHINHIGASESAPRPPLETRPGGGGNSGASQPLPLNRPPKSDALLAYLRREGRGHYADPSRRPKPA